MGLRRSQSWGWTAYWLYRTMTYGVSPLAYLLLHCRRLRGLEHPVRWKERLGRPSSPRPLGGSLLWFHAVSLGEGLAAIPVIRHCLSLQQQQQEQTDRSRSFTKTSFSCAGTDTGTGGLSILLTTTTASAFDAIHDLLPDNVIHQFAPIDTPAATDSFIAYWKPDAIFLIDSELWPNLIMTAAANGIAVALLNARMSAKSFHRWSTPLALPLISLMLSKLSLIAALSTTEAIRFQLLQASPIIVKFPGNLKYASGDLYAPKKEARNIDEIHQALVNRPVWMASSIHHGEEEDILWIHHELLKKYPKLVSILVPRYPRHGKQIALMLRKNGSDVLLRSENAKFLPTTQVYIVDTLGELQALYRLTPIAVIGGSFLPGFSGHNISEAAAAGSAVLTGPHVGHFSHMILEMLQIEPFAVWQVSSKMELLGALLELLGDPNGLKVRQRAAKRAISTISVDIVDSVWNLISADVLKNYAILR